MTRTETIWMFQQAADDACTAVLEAIMARDEETEATQRGTADAWQRAAVLWCGGRFTRKDALRWAGTADFEVQIASGALPLLAKRAAARARAWREIAALVGETLTVDHAVPWYQPDVA